VAHALLSARGMTQKNREGESEGRAKQTVLVVGGNGGLSDRYREVAAEHGWDLVHYEKKVPPGARHGIAHVALVVVMVGMVSHTLRDQVRSLATADAPVVYLRTASMSALRAAMAQRAA
jgi:uncharacterized protein YgbK (DUF1537 family)